MTPARLFIVVCWLVLAWGQVRCPAAESGDLNVFTNVSDIRRLSRDESGLAQPVNLKGVVTYSDPSWSVLFIHDAAAGIFVDLAGGSYPTNQELVQVVGRTGQGSFLPVVTAASWRHLGTAPLPEARRIERSERFATDMDAEWSEFQGVARRVSLSAEQNHVQIDLFNPYGEIRLFVPVPDRNEAVSLLQLVDAAVTIHGVGGVDFRDASGGMKLKGFIPSRNDIHVLEQPPIDSFSLAQLSLAELRGLVGTNVPAHRVHVHGLVTHVAHPGWVVLQDEGAAVRVQFSATNDVEVGATVEATGFVSQDLFSPVLVDALVRPAAGNLRAEPVSVTPATVLWGDYDARLVRITGVFQGRGVGPTNEILTLLQDGILFGVSLPTTVPAKWGQLQKGDRLAVTGVCSIQGGQHGAPQSFQVLLRSANDLERLPPLQVFSLRQVAIIGIVAAAAWGLSLLWGVALRRRVRQQTSDLAHSLSLLNATIESTADGILVVDRNGQVTSYNTTFARMWALPQELAASKCDARLLEFVMAQLQNGEAFLGKVRELYANPESESFDILEFKDGRTFERYSQPQRLDGRCVGRVWCFRDVTARKQAEAKFEAVRHELLETSRQVGMAEVATAVLHNVGNVLNSVNVSATLVDERLRRCRARYLAEAAALIEGRMDDLQAFLAQDPKGKALSGYLKELSLALMKDNQAVRREVESLLKNIEHIKAVVATQQSYARVSGRLEKLDPKDMMEDAVQINCAAFQREQIRVVREYGPVPQVLVDRHKVLQILINLLSNARHALQPTVQNERKVTLSIFPIGVERVCLRVADNGVGVAQGNLDRIFNQGFTTRKDGHGFGLHSGANAAKEMNGSLRVDSDGPGKGATFTLELPIGTGPGGPAMPQSSSSTGFTAHSG